MKNYFILLMILSIFLYGCSTGVDNPIAPVKGELERTQSLDSSHTCLGYWMMIADPDESGLDIVELRTVSLHLNALPFLEPPPLLHLTLESPPQFSGGMLDVDIGLRHPFLGLNEFTGFDVCGILITSGSMSGYEDPDIVTAGFGDTRLVNADGLTRWWNPVEFPYNPDAPIKGYVDGMLGTPDSSADYTATLNGYKYFADALDIESSPSTIDPGNRGYFSAGQKNIRHYTISLDSDLIFNYAVDASWRFPTGSSPWEVPGSFSPSANRPEAFFIEPSVVENELWYHDGSYGGYVSLDIHVYDWFDADENHVVVECPGVFETASSSTPISGGANYSIYHIDLVNPTLTSSNTIHLLVRAECDIVGYQDMLPGNPVTGYAPLQHVIIADESQLGLIAHDEGLITNDGYTNYDDFEPALTIDGEGRMWIGYFWCQATDPTHFYNFVRYNESNDGGLTFGSHQIGAWHTHGSQNFVQCCYNFKFYTGPDGRAWSSYDTPTRHALGCIPDFDPYDEAMSINGVRMSHAGNMLYTSEGYPMMFGDYDGIIKMRRGDYPNQGGTGTWPNYGGTQCLEIENAWLSVVRSVGITSDGICRLVYWKGGIDAPIRMRSSDDISGTSWTTENVIQDGAMELWIGAHDPSLWIDENDHFHVAYAGDTWMEDARLVYAYSEDGVEWTNTIIDNAVTFEDLELHDTSIVTFNAFEKQYIFLTYEYHGNVWFQYKQADLPGLFSEPVKVNVHENAALPDLYPNDANGIIFAYEADGDNGNTDIFYRVYEFVMQ